MQRCQTAHVTYCDDHQMMLVSIESKEKQNAIFSVWDKSISDCNDNTIDNLKLTNQFDDIFK
jgi:hypothetical protein